MSGCWPLPDVRGHAVKNRPRDSESRRHRLHVTLVEGIDVLAYCRHRVVRTHLCHSILRWRLRESLCLSGCLSTHEILQHWTETNPERDPVEITTFHVIVTLYFADACDEEKGTPRR